METIFARRSVRSYSSQPVSEAQINGLIRAAMAAPSAGNEQPWEFVVVRERSLLEAVMAVHPYAAMLRQAPAAIVVCADPRRGKYPFDYWIQDCAAAAQNMLLAATGEGLGACWLGVYPQPERVAALRRIFSIPEPVVPFCVVAVGHPAQPQTAVDRFDPARIHYEQWRQPGSVG
ncbi:MAG: nitroreductase family protein [Sporomusaceae bacterium]|nr:nitroreductase family protein [Sporomusaceae bacterium]